MRPLKAVCNVPNLVPECSEIVLILSDLGFVASNLLSGKGPLLYKFTLYRTKQLLVKSMRNRVVLMCACDPGT